MRLVHRDIDPYLKSRASYLESLELCSADIVAEASCSLCKAVHFYTYRLHVIAVRLRSLYPEILDLNTF